MTFRTTLAAAAATLALLAGGTLAPAQAAPITFTNPTALSIPDGGTFTGTGASSGIAVSGVTGTVTDIDVQLNGLSHTFARDLEFYLQGPLGQVVVLLNDVGGNNDWTNDTVTFSDGSPAMISSSPGSDGTFAPTKSAFACAAPLCAGAGTALSVFNGLDPNGTWTLFAYDDIPGDTGRIANGWSLILTTVTTNTPVPEPASLALLGAGLLGLVAARRRGANGLA